MTMLEHALHYAGLGLEVFPLQADKTPYPGSRGMKEGTTDSGQIRRWWKAKPDSVIGCRIPADLLVLDLDVRHGGGATWEALEWEFDPITVGRTHWSGRGDGGRHHWFLRPDGPITIRGLHEWSKDHGVGQEVNGVWRCGIDLLHHGHRYTILPPSIHAATGKPYTWGTSALEEAPGILPDFLVELLQREPEPPAPAAPRTPGETDGPLDWYREHQTWRGLLSAHGWRLVAGNGDEDRSRWRHPAATSSYSATIRHGCLFVYSPNTPFDETADGDPRGYTLGRAYAVLEHDGDLSRASRAILELRDGPRPRRDDDLSSWVEQPKAKVKAQLPAPSDPDDDWPDPIPLSSVRNLPEFPVWALPEWMQARALEVSASLSCSIDLPSMLGLAALAVVGMGRAKVKVKGDYLENLNLFVIVAMPPSTGKSPTYDRMLGAVRRFEKSRVDLDESRRAGAKARLKMAEGDVITAEKNKNVNDLGAAILEVEAAKANLGHPYQLIVDDVTPERFAEILGEQHGRIAMLSTEAGPIQIMAGRYSDGLQSRLEHFLKCWSGDSIRVDRVSRRETPVIVDKALATICLTVQPDVLRGIAAEMRGRGLTARFLYAIPEDRRRLIDTPDEDHAVAELYDQTLLGLLERWHSYAMPAVLDLEPAARASWMAWSQAASDRAHHGDLKVMREWVGKITANVARIAGLMHIGDGKDHATPIDAATMDRAIAIGEYAVAHAQAVHDMWQVDEGQRVAQALLAWLHETHPDGGTFVRRDVMRAMKSALPTRDAADMTLRRLDDLGWVRLVAGSYFGHGNSVDAPTWQVRAPMPVDNWACLTGPKGTDVPGTVVTVPIVPYTRKSVSSPLSTHTYTRATPGTIGTVTTVHPQGESEPEVVTPPARPSLKDLDW